MRIIKTGVERLRDPFVLKHGNTYYMYGTGVDGRDWNNTVWACYRNDSGKLDGKWERVQKELYICPKYAKKNFWAPEVHRYKDYYYMIATYYSSRTNHRGCCILKADNPEGPFAEITNGHITSENYDAIDGTFYLDDDSQAWMIFVREWTTADDGVGRMVAAKMSDDLTRFISEPIELFRADDPLWSNAKVTDGCFMHKTKEGKLLMLWSNFCKSGYCVGIAESNNGKVDGVWKQQEELLFSKETTGEYDGGHGMIFTDTDGEMYILVHSPNDATDESGEKSIMIPIVEENGTLICKK